MGFVLKTHLWSDPFVTNSLVRMFLEIGVIELARKVFDKIPVKDLISWNSLLTGYLRAGEIDMAREVFEKMPQRDVVSCNAMIDGYGKHGKCELAGELSGIAELGFVEEGKWVHTYVINNKIHYSSSFFGSALINMYAKCGQIENAFSVFRSICHRRKIGDWNSMISGLALHGLGREAIEVFLELERAKLKPDDITFLGLLSACNHGGLVKEGQFYFETMQVKYKIVPKMQHYGCIIDLLSACLKHNNFVMGHTAAMQAIELTPEDSSCYVLLSNIYAKKGRWDEVTKVRSIMKKGGVRKIPGCSSILVDGRVHEFLMGKVMVVGHNQIVLSKLEEVVSELKLEGYEPDLNQVFVDIEDDEKENQLTLHSEKMALAFGLMSIPQDIPIYIVKILRICCDCHTFMQLVSKVYNRRVIVRDQNRFHHFDKGCCSCRNHW